MRAALPKLLLTSLLALACSLPAHAQSSSGSEDIEIRDRAKSREMLDGLMGRTIFPEADRIMREQIDRRNLHQCGQAKGSLAIVAELEKRRNERASELQMDPTVIASRATLAALAQDGDEAANDLMKWQRELLLPSL